MAIKHTVNIEPGWTLPSVWAHLVRLTRQWLAEHQLMERDAVVLLPFAALLPPLREAFAQAGGWQLRVETTLTLGASLAPPPEAAPGDCCGDAVLDRLNAALLLRSQRGVEALFQRDAPGFDHLVGLVVDAAQAFMAQGQALAPADREAFWAQARSGVLQTSGGPASAGLESRLLGVALEWAAASSAVAAPQSDQLHSLQPSAWVVVRLGGEDPVADAVAQHSDSPALWLDLDPALGWPAAAGQATPEQGNTNAIGNGMGAGSGGVSDDGMGISPETACWLCDDFEAEAQAVAALTVDAVNAGRVPVGLVAVDRALVRRVRALLDRQHVPVLDETGWLLATTGAGARVMALLQTAQALQRAQAHAGMTAADCPGASRDTALAWLKSAADVDASALRATAGVDALEALWRERRRAADRAAAEGCWQDLLAHLTPLANAAPGSLAQWLARTRQVLQAEGDLTLMEFDPAGRQVLAALRIQGGEAAWNDAAGATRLVLSGFVAWVSATLEQSPYLPLPDEQALVVLTPLARAFGRSFGQVVVPGADHQQLGSPVSSAALIGPPLARQLGMPDARQRHLLQRLALVHLMRGGPVTFTRRLRDDGQPLSESPDLAWLMQVWRGKGQAAPRWLNWQAALREVQPQPVAHPLPTAPDDLPRRLSASQLDVYRQCPYRFFARAVLRLDEPEELDAGLAKRDYGNWLHEVLHRFHSERDHRQGAEAQLQAAAAWATQKLAMDDADLLPWRASFEHFSPNYLRWLAAREAQGWFWADGETEHERHSDELPGTHLRGRLDRLDHGPDGQREVIDYKTGDAAALKTKVKQPLEDTQLAFYAALLATPEGVHGGGGELRACYLALDDAKAPVVIAHPDVESTAAQMVESLSGEWQRLRAGEAMQALGEGAPCETCEARGLCRRDHWGHAIP